MTIDSLVCRGYVVRSFMLAVSTALLVSLPSAALAQGQTVCGPEVKAEIVKALSNAV